MSEEKKCEWLNERVELPMDTPELSRVPLGARAAASVINRFYGSF